MKRSTPFVALLCIAVFCTAAIAEEALTNDNIIELLNIGLADSVIVEKIRTSPTDFDTSVSELKRLKAAGVSDTVIGEMLRAGAAVGAATEGAGGGDPNDPRTPRESGIYYHDDGERMHRMTPTVSLQTKVGGMWKSAFTYGAAKVKARAILEGEQAQLQIDERRPAFYFYFEDTGTFGGISPEEFALVRMRLNKGNREMVVATANITGAKAGALEKFAVDFEATEVGRGIYKVVPTEDLEDGEYGFYYGGTSTGMGGIGGPQGGSTRVFDFSVRG